MAEKVCCVTGHRDIPAGKVEEIRGRLQAEIARAWADGYTYYISGFAEGIDLMFAEIVADLKDTAAPFLLEAALPYAGRAQHPSVKRLLARCNSVSVHSKVCTRHCYLDRDRYMVDQSSRVIAVYDGRARGGTLYTINYARAMKREIALIRI